MRLQNSKDLNSELATHIARAKRVIITVNENITQMAKWDLCQAG